METGRRTDVTKPIVAFRNFVNALKIFSSYSSSGSEPPLIGGFGLLNDILPLCSILDTG